MSNLGLIAANAVREQSLRGQSPRARGHEKTLIALDWIYRWGWASPRTVDQIGGAQRRGLGARLVRAGVLIETPTAAPGALTGVPSKILTLSEIGLGEAELNHEALLPYSVDPARVRQDRLRHNELVQRLTADAASKQNIRAYRSEREIVITGGASDKIPDALWQMPGRDWVSLEVELTAKWGRALDQFVTGSVQILKNGIAGHPIQQLIIVSTSQALIQRYQAAFSPDATANIWRKSPTGRWGIVETLAVPGWVIGRVRCCHVRY